MPTVFYTHWTLPRRTPGSGYEHDWPTRAHAYLAWALSTTLAARYVGPVAIATDVEGAADLEWIGLPAKIHVVFGEELRPLVRYWTAGKLATYYMPHEWEGETFVHLDNDVFLTKPLPPSFFGVPLGVQSVEPLTKANYAGYYLPTLDAMLRRGLDVPAWKEESARPLDERPAYNLGLLVANGPGLSVLKETSRLGLRAISHASTSAADLPASNVCVAAEQYTFGAVARALRVPVATLLSDASTEQGQADAARLGYVHLFGSAKRDPAALERMVRRARIECPDAYRRILARFPL